MAEKNDRRRLPGTLASAGALGGARDEHGCAITAGYVHCPATDSCIRPFSTACPVEGGTEFAGPASIRCSSGRCSLAGEGCELKAFGGTFALGGYYLADLDGGYDLGGGCVATCEGCGPSAGSGLAAAHPPPAPGPAPAPAIASSGRWEVRIGLDRSSVAHDAVEGFLLAGSAALLALLVRRRLCRRSGRRGAAGGYRAVSTDLYHGTGTGADGDPWDAGSSCSDSLDEGWGYGEEGMDEARMDLELDRRAEEFFSREERIGAGGVRRGGRAAEAVRSALDDDEEGGPLDLEMIERRALDSMEDGPEFANTSEEENGSSK